MSAFTFLGKYILYLFNLLCLISAVGIMSIAFIINQKFYKLSNFISTDLINAPQILLVIGLVVLVIAIIGLCGVIRDNGCLLTLFSILLTIVLVGELVLSGIVYQMHDEIENYASKEMKSTISSYNKTGKEFATQAWDLLQNDLGCCGINGPKDWILVTHNENLPKSCCYAIPLNGSCTESDSYNDGCLKVLETNLQRNRKLIIWTAVGFAIVQLLAVLLACCRKCSIRDEYETV